MEIPGSGVIRAKSDRPVKVRCAKCKELLGEVKPGCDLRSLPKCSCGGSGLIQGEEVKRGRG